MTEAVIGAVAPAGRAEAYARASTWAQDLEDSRRASRRLAWIVAAGAAVVAGLEALALCALVPLKSVQPYTILVDRQTGYVETARGLQPGKLTQDAAVSQSFVMQYVMARETFDATDLRENFRKVTLWSDGAARAQYRQGLDRGNPQSPLRLLPATTVLSTVIKSVSMLSPTTALVRFDTIRRDAGATSGEQRPWTAVITFRYSGAPMTMGDRAINPLGFQVLTYRRDPEGAGSATVRLDPLGNVVP